MLTATLGKLRELLEGLGAVTSRFNSKLDNMGCILEGTRKYLLNPGLSQSTHPVTESRKSKVLAWISTLPYTSHHKRISEQRLEGTGTWLFDKKEYRNWRGSNTSKLLLLRGIRKSQPMLDLNSCLTDLFNSWGWKNLHCVSDIHVPTRNLRIV
jgi:hypothetical protein